ncbi:MAG: hypothetical protein GTN75_00125 [Gemmatimonadetes bacterium]|nr:hypothetical protein [Gemmatimonadota bacterium]
MISKALRLERWLAKTLLPSSREIGGLLGNGCLQRERSFNTKNKRIRFQWRDSTSPMGRFGGGWQYELGVQVGRSSTIVNLGVFSVRIDGRKG